MPDRQPQILSIHPHRENRNPVEIRMTIVYRGLKGEPVDVITLTPREAARFIASAGRALVAKLNDDASEPQG